MTSRVLAGFLLVTIGAATVFKFAELFFAGSGNPETPLIAPVSSTTLEWVLSFILVLAFGVVPIALGCFIIFRNLASPPR